MKLKKLLAIVLCFAMVLSSMSFTVFAAEGTPVAKVGNTEYATINDAITNWTNGTTLTLLANVTLSDVIKLSSTESHILDLGTYTMTAASGKDAIQYVVNGRSTLGFALDIKADATNPGGITATGGSVVRHTKPLTGAPTKDRPITRFYGGVFNASYVVRQGGTFGAGYTGASAPAFYFYGGEFNGTIYTNRSQNQFYGGTFNGSMQMSVDSSAYTMIAGGTYKNLSNSMGSELNSDKFTIGSSKGANNGSVCIDEDGNYVITTATPANAEASVASNYNSSNYFYYSTVNTNGMYYEDVYDALEGNKTGTVTVFTDELDLTDTSFTGTIVVPKGQEITIVVEKGTTPAWSISEDAAVTYTDAEGNVLEKGNGGVFAEPAPDYAVTVNGVGYTDIQEAIKAAAPDGTVEVLADVTVDKWVMFAEKLTIGNGNLITLNINGLNINGNGHTLTINSIESAGNGSRLFYDAQKLNIKDLTIKYADDLSDKGGIGLQSGTISNVTFDGGVYGVLPGTGDVTIEDCTFKTNGTSIYFEGNRDDLVVTGNKFENADGAYAILLRGDVTFTDNTITTGKVNVVNGSPVVTGNNFGEERFKVYNEATATIEDNQINVLAFNDDSKVKSIFNENNLSDEAQAVLDAATAPSYVAFIDTDKDGVMDDGETGYESLLEAIEAAKGGDTIVLLADTTEAITAIENVKLTTNVEGGVTITNTYADEYVDFNNVTLGSGVTLNVINVLSSGDNSVNVIEGTLNASGVYYHSSNAKTTIHNGGNVTTGGMTIVRYNTNPEAGIYIYGDNNNETVEFTCNGDAIGAYSGTFYAEDAVIVTKSLRLDYKKNDSEESDEFAPIDANFKNSDVKVNVDLRLYKDANLTLTGTSVTVKEVQIRENATPVVKMNSSTIKATSVMNLTGATLNAVLGEDGTVSFKRTGLTGSGTQEDPYLISSLDDLKLFRDDVNAGNNYKGEYIKLTADIDLAGGVAVASDEVVSNWTPIGTADAKFEGIFDGDGKTISNLIVNEPDSSYLGLFGYFANATIKNVNIKNVTAFGKSYVAAVAGMAYTGIIENCHVSGTIRIEGNYCVGGIAGAWYANATNSSVIGDGVDTSYIKGVYTTGNNLEGDNVAGIIANGAESRKVTGCSVKDITIVGTRKVGAIIGSTTRTAVLKDCSVENVKIGTNATADYASANTSSMTIGGLIGHYYGDGTGGSVTNCTVKNVTFTNKNNVSVNAGPIVGGNRTTPNQEFTGVTSTGNKVYISTITGSTNTYLMNAVAQIGDTNYYGLQAALAAAKDGDTITLLADVAIDKTLTINIEGNVTIDGNGHKITNDGATNAAVMLGTAGYTDAAIASHKVTLKNVVFDGWATDHVVRIQGVEAVIDGCTIINSNQTAGLALISTNNADVTVKNCVFKDNTCLSVIDVNSWADESKSAVTVENCKFNNNTCSTIGMIVVITGGDGIEIKNNELIGNTAVANIVYASTDVTISGNYFKDNNLTEGPHNNDSIVVAGPWTEGTFLITITGNAFCDDERAVYVEKFMDLGANSSFDLDGNYWNGGVPNYGSTGDPDVKLETYYTSCSYADSVLKLENPADVARTVAFIDTDKDGVMDDDETGYTDFESVIAAAVADASITHIMILSDISQTTIANPDEVYAINANQNLTIGAPDGEEYTVTLSRDGGKTFSIYLMDDNASLTIGKNVTIEGLEILANGFATSGNNLTIDGNIKAVSLKQWTSNGTITISETGSVWLGYGDGQFDLAYGNGTVTVNGNGDKSTAQFKAGYSGTRGNGNTLNLNNTYFDGGAWFNVYGSNGTINVNNSVLAVSGGDSSGRLTISSTGNAISLTNGSELKVANLTIGADNSVTLGAGCSINAATISGTGSIVIDATGMSVGTVATITGNASGFTGTIKVINNDSLEAYVDENGNIVLAEAKTYVAQIGDDEFETLAGAITAAQAGDIIKLIADVNENVTVSKSLTIDGANKNYTGNISVDDSITKNIEVTVKNINFVNGTGYAITTNRIKSITVEDCTVTNYGYGFLYANKSTPTVNVKNVTVDGGNYGFHWVYGTSATLENVKMTNVTNGLLIQNYAGKTITLKNCNITSINIWERDGYSGVQTFKFEGENTVATLTDSQYAKYVLAAADATLTAPEGSTVTTNLDDYFVKYADGTYKAVEAIVNYVAEVNGEKYESLAEAASHIATDGSDTTIKILTDIEVSESIAFEYGAGDIIFTADKPVTIKQTALSTDFVFTERQENNIIIEENVTIEVYDNNSGMYLYYGPSLQLNGTITGGQNWGALYLFNGEHIVSETGKIGTGRVQLGYTDITVNGEVDTNYLLVENSTFTADGATVDAGVIYDNNNGGQRWGASEFSIKNGSEVTTDKLTLSYADTVLTIDMSSTINAATITGAGKIIIDAADYEDGDACPITGNASDFTGTIKVINNDSLEASVDENGNIVLTKVEELKKFHGTNIDMGNTLDMNFYFYKEYVDADGYAEIINTANGDTATVQLSDCGLSGDYYIITYPGLAAKQMCDELEVTVYDADGNQVSETKVESIRSYVLRILENVDDDDTKTLMVDMLNYGAAAQEAFEYKTDDLANSTLTDDQKALGTQEMKACANNFSKSNDDYYLGTNYDLESRISMNMYVLASAIGENGYAVVNYTNHLGESKEITINDYTVSGDYYVFNLSDIVVADGRCELNIEFFTSDGASVVEVTDSMESYVARMSGDYPWLETIMNFSDAAYTYLHNRVN